MNEIILHPKVQYGTYIFTLLNVWSLLRRGLVDADSYETVDDMLLNHDTDRLLKSLVEESFYYNDHENSPLSRTVAYLQSSDHYHLDRRYLGMIIGQAKIMYLDNIAHHLPWLMQDPGIRVDAEIKNRFDLYLTVGPVYDRSLPRRPGRPSPDGDAV